MTRIPAALLVCKVAQIITLTKCAEKQINTDYLHNLRVKCHLCLSLSLHVSGLFGIMKVLLLDLQFITVDKGWELLPQHARASSWDKLLAACWTRSRTSMTGNNRPRNVTFEETKLIAAIVVSWFCGVVPTSVTKLLCSPASGANSQPLVHGTFSLGTFSERSETLDGYLNSSQWLRPLPFTQGMVRLKYLWLVKLLRRKAEGSSCGSGLQWYESGILV